MTAISSSSPSVLPVSTTRSTEPATAQPEGSEAQQPLATSLPPARDSFDAAGPTGTVNLGGNDYTVTNGSVSLRGQVIGTVTDDGSFDVTIDGARSAGKVGELTGAVVAGALSTGQRVDNRVSGIVQVGGDTFEVRQGQAFKDGARVGTINAQGSYAVALGGQNLQGNLGQVAGAQYVGVRADGVTVSNVPTSPRYPQHYNAGWDPSGRTIPGAGFGRISQDPLNPFGDRAGEPGQRTGATFIQVVPTVSPGSSPNSIELVNPLVSGRGPYSEQRPPPNAPSGVMLTDFSGRVADYKTFGSQADVARLLSEARSPEEYAAGLEKLGGYYNGMYVPFGVTAAVDGSSPTGKVDLSPQFALGNYAQVATYLAANPDVQELARQHPTLHPHVVAEWHYAQFGRAEERQWPQEVTLLPNFTQVVGYGSNGHDPFAKQALEGYLQRNPDVRELAARFGEDPISFALRHYDQVGRLEGRSMGPRNYVGASQNDPDFERYYRGEMSPEEADAFFNRGGSVDPVATTGASSSSALASASVSGGVNQLRAEAALSDQLLEQLGKLGPRALARLLERLRRAGPTADIGELVRQLIAEERALAQGRTIRG